MKTGEKENLALWSNQMPKKLCRMNEKRTYVMRMKRLATYGLPLAINNSFGSRNSTSSSTTVSSSTELAPCSFKNFTT